jgi:1,4-alpha-glucan branching enzyme
MLFMGQEMLEDTKFEPQPAPLDWGKATRNAPIVAFYKDMIRLRRNLDGASGGLGGKNVAVTHLNDSGANKVVAFRRWGAGNDDVMVIANFGATRYVRYDVGVPSAGTWTARVDSDTKKYGADFGRASVTAVDVVPQSRDGLPATASVALGPYSMVVLTR